MRKPGSILVALAVAGGFLALYLLYPPLPLLETGEYEEETVTITAEDGTQLASVDVRIAQTRDQRRIGLSRTDALADGTGMLFVHSGADTHSYVMRNMSFGIDIIFIDSDGTITDIHSAPAPPDDDAPYEGFGQYVLEVPYNWSAEMNVTTGDTVSIPTGVQ